MSFNLNGSGECVCLGCGRIFSSVETEIYALLQVFPNKRNHVVCMKCACTIENAPIYYCKGCSQFISDGIVQYPDGLCYDCHVEVS